MTTLLLLAATAIAQSPASWGYDGFAADTVKAVSPAPPEDDRDRNPFIVDPDPAPPPPPDVAPPPPYVPPPPPPAPAPEPPAPPPTLYQLADAWGQVWTHADPEYLRQWVAQRNAQLAVPPAAVYRGPAYCPPGATR